MDGNSANKAPVLDHLVDTSSVPASSPTSPPPQPNNQVTKKIIITAVNNTQKQAEAMQNDAPVGQNIPHNRRTDKSEFEIELTKTVTRVMMKHFEHASEEIVAQVLNEVRARLPGQKKA